MLQPLNAGFAVESAFTFGKTAYDFDVTEDGKPTKIKVRLADIAEKGDLKTNIAVRPGDVLVIPESRF